MSVTVLKTWMKFGVVALVFVFTTSLQAGVILHYNMESGTISAGSMNDQSGSPVNNAGRSTGGSFGIVADTVAGLVVALPESIAVLNANGLIAPDEFTFSCWYKGTGTGYFFDQKTTRFVINQSLGVHYIGGAWYSTSGLPSALDGEWHHMAIVCTDNGTDAVFIPYLDGVAGASMTASGKGKASLTQQAGADQRIGSAYSGTASKLAGLYDDIMVHDTALSASEVKALYDSTFKEEGLYITEIRDSNPTEVFHLITSAAEYGSGLAAAQFSHGITNGPALTKDGGYLGFGNGNTWADVVPTARSYWNSGAVTDLNLGAGSVVAWINPDFSGDGTQVFILGNGGPNGDVNADKIMNMYIRTGGDLAVAVDGKIIESASALQTATDTWFMVAATWDQSTGIIRLYLNGNEISSYTGSTWDDTGNFDYLYVGKEPAGSSRDYNGYIDEISTWTNVLGASQIKAFYERGTKGPIRGTVISVQ